MTESKRRTRLSPAARTDQLLDTARKMIITEGLQAFTMEALARTAGVSSPLVYNYFESRPALLQALLKREYGRFVAESSASVLATDSFEQVVRVSVASNFDHHATGNILPILMSQPEIKAAIAAEQAESTQQNARFLVRSAAKTYHLTTAQAQLAVSMSSGASIAAAQYAAEAGLDRETTITQTTAYILAGIRDLAGVLDT